MKRIAVLLLVAAMLFLCGCSWQLPDVNDPSYKYLYQESEPSGDSAVQIMGAESTTAQQQETVASELFTEEPYSGEESSVSESDTAEAASEEITSSESAGFSENVDLSISMPQQNGSMYTDSASDNKFIVIVHEQKKISKDLLVAVFSLPDTGQNYVFEFYNATGRTADDLRRVYLIDSNGDIVSISAVDNSEREGIGTVENWFSMNVLIKEVIFPAISESISK